MSSRPELIIGHARVSRGARALRELLRFGVKLPMAQYVAMQADPQSVRYLAIYYHRDGRAVVSLPSEDVPMPRRERLPYARIEDAVKAVAGDTWEYTRLGNITYTFRPTFLLRKRGPVRPPRRNPSSPEAAIARAGGDGELARWLVNEWAASASSRGAIALRILAGGVGLAPRKAVMADLARFAEDDAELARITATVTRHQSKSGLSDETYAATVAAMAALSQAQHPASVTLYRGVGPQQAAKLGASGTRVALDVDALSSWTDSLQVARRIAERGAAGLSGRGAVLEAVVPRDRVVLSHRAGFDALRDKDEDEVVVASDGRIDATVLQNDGARANPRRARRNPPARAPVEVDFTGKSGAKKKLRVVFDRGLADWYVYGRESRGSGSWWRPELGGLAAETDDGLYVAVTELAVQMRDVSEARELREVTDDPRGYLRERYGMPFFVALQGALS